MEFGSIISIISAIAGCVVGVAGAIGVLWRLIKKPFDKLNRKFEDINNRLETNKQELLDAIAKGDNANLTSVLRVELNQLIELEPDNEDSIYKIYDEYKKLCGNHYMDAKIKRWEAQQLEKKLTKEDE